MNFVNLVVTKEVIAQAKQIRAERDKRYKNIFAEGRNDVRWVGEIDEICFDSWAKANTNAFVEWIIQREAKRLSYHSITFAVR